MMENAACTVAEPSCAAPQFFRVGEGYIVYRLVPAREYPALLSANSAHSSQRLYASKPRTPCRKSAGTYSEYVMVTARLNEHGAAAGYAPNDAKIQFASALLVYLVAHALM